MYNVIDATYEAKYREGVREGVRAGVKDNLKRMARNLLAVGIPLEQIAAAAEVSVGEVQELLIAEPDGDNP